MLRREGGPSSKSGAMRAAAAAAAVAVAAAGVAAAVVAVAAENESMSVPAANCRSRALMGSSKGP